MEFCCCWVGFNILEGSVMATAILFNHDELIDGKFNILEQYMCSYNFAGVLTNWIRTVDNLDITRLTCYLGYIFESIKSNEPNPLLDLIAVLCPFGPLKLLIESSKSQQREVPALLYSVNAIWLMMANPGQHFYNSDNNPNEDQFQHSGQTFDQQRASHDGFMRLNDSSQPTIILDNNTTTTTTTNEAKNENDNDDNDDDDEDGILI